MNPLWNKKERKMCFCSSIAVLQPSNQISNKFSLSHKDLKVDLYPLLEYQSLAHIKIYETSSKSAARVGSSIL